MVGRLYWASCARATGIDALLRRSPPPRRAAAYIRRQQAGGFWRATDYIRQAVVGTDVLLRRSPRVVLPQISGNSRPADFGGRLSILGGDKPCVGSGYRRSAAPFSPRVVRSPIFGDSSPTNFGGRLAILGKLCVDNGRRRSAAPLSLHRSAANIRRQRFNGRALHRALPLSHAIAKVA